MDAGHLAAAGYDVSNHPSNHVLEEEEEESITDLSEEDTNYTMFDLNVDTIDVTLSLARWLAGKGLVKDAVVKGVRGVVGEYTIASGQLYGDRHLRRPAIGVLGSRKSSRSRCVPAYSAAR